MFEGVYHGGPPGEASIEVRDSPIPDPEDDQVLIRVEFSGSNPKDWKYPEFLKKDMNSGDDIAGYIEKVGKDVTEFKPGDRVAAFHQMGTRGGSFAEFALAPAHTTFILPDNVSFEEGATVPLAAATAGVGLYINLELPPPWNPATKSTPLIVYGASSAVGAFTIKLATRSNLHPIIAVGGRGEKFVKSIIDESKGDVFVDYRDGEEKLVEGMKAGLKGAEVYYAYDAISEKGSFQACSKVLSEGGKITLVLPNGDFSAIPKTLTSSITYVGLVHDNTTPDNKTVNFKTEANGVDFGYLFFKLMGKGMKDGWFKAHPYEIVPGGLRGVLEALLNLREGKSSAIKYIFRISETSKE